MAERNPYDTDEAVTLFAKSHAARDPTAHYKGRADAAELLLDAVLKAAEEAGYEVERRGAVGTISHIRRGAVYLRLDDDTLSVIGADNPHAVRKDLPIEYDPSDGIFVSTKVDAFYVPTPGHPARRRSAVAELAEVVSAMIDAQTSLRSRS